MPANSPPYLSKTRFVGGLQCLKRLYLESYHRKLADPIDASLQARFDTGTALGELARDMFPGGRLVEEDYTAHDSAARKTQSLASDDAVPSIYEAAFTFEGIRTRVDVLQRLDSGDFALVEVKSGTSVKPEHIPDAAIQTYVAEGAGLNVRKVYLVHIDNSYVYEGGPYILDRLFRMEEVTDQVRSYMAASLASDLARMREALERSEQPEISIGRHCAKPYTCPFYQHCRKDTPEHHIEQLPGARSDLLELLISSGIDDIHGIPEGFSGLSPGQERVRDSVMSGEPYVGEGLRASLSEVQDPLLFLDFETFNPALPMYPGTRPYQMIPFQWSLHILHRSGQLEHRDFLHTGPDDPRPAFMDSLLEAAGTTGTIIVYSNFEEARLKQLADEFPEYAQGLLALCERIFDLYKAVRAHYYHPEFHGSYSLKSVLPAVVPGLTYAGLGIQEGQTASLAFARKIAPETDETERAGLHSDLLEYCRRDTQALVEVFQALRFL